jgi:hypothetical protein
MKYPACRGAPAPDMPASGAETSSRESLDEDSGSLHTVQAGTAEGFDLG